MSETASIKAIYPSFKVSHDRTIIELMEKKKYDALKQELKSKLDACQTIWKIKRSKNGLTLVNNNSFVKPQTATQAWKSDSLKKLKCLSDKFFVTYTNTDCLSSKWEEFSELIKQCKPHLVGVTEVLPKHFSNPSIYFQQLPQYNLVSDNSAKKGICIYIHGSTKFSVVANSLVDLVLECLLVDEIALS